MSSLLYIKANPKSDLESNTFKISEEFIRVYQEEHPQEEVITLDLYQEGVQPLRGEDIQSIFAPDTASKKDHPILKYAHQFKDVDKYVFSAPMWNLSIPSILKAYIDYITVPGITFKYTEEGPVGLCSGKGMYIVTRGGTYTEPPFADFEMGERYLRTILGFLGIGDVDSIVAEELNVIGKDWDAIVNKTITEAQQKAKVF